MFRILALLLISIPAFAGGFPAMEPGDDRLVRSSSSPKWLAAVGRQVNKLSKTTQEQCSLTLVADNPTKDGIIVVGAGHCADHWAAYNGGFDVEENSVTFQSNDGTKVTRRIVEVIKAETHKGDYFIGKLDRYISRSIISPLMNSPYDYSDMMDEEYFGKNFKPFATVAGYSADTGKGQKGTVLTYDEHAQLNGGARGLKKAYAWTYQGASGGPVVVTVDLDDMADEDWQVGRRTYFVGSVVGARMGDGPDKTMFTDTTYHTKTLDKVLADH